MAGRFRAGPAGWSGDEDPWTLLTVTFLYMHKDWCDCSNSECNSQNGSLLEVDKKITWGYFSPKITKTIQAKLSYIGLFFIKNLFDSP